jgi:putative ABC transport system permease protein
VLLARRNLLKDKTRFALSVSGVALAVMLVLVLSGLLTGSYRQITGYLDHASASVVVAQEGVGNLLGATSLLPPDTARRAATTAGAVDATPILSQFVILDLHGKKQPAYLIGYDPALGGGPWQMAAGRTPATDDELVLDRVLAERHNLTTGDTFELLGRTFRIVGLSDGTTSWMTSFFFIRKGAAEDLLRAPGATSFLLVTPEPGASAETLRDRLAEIPGADALLKADVAANDLALFARFFSAPLKLMSGIAFLVGALVVGLVIYTATVERQREYGVLKAIGARNGTLYGVVLLQALIAALGGVGLGLLLAYAAAEVIMLARPQFLVVLDPFEAARAVVVGLAMALAAALLPARVVAGLAPAEVFRR